MQRPVLQVLLKSADAKFPARGSPNAAGLDLFSAQNYDIPANRNAIISTDIAVVLPHGCYGRVAPRSGLAVKYGIHVGAGVIDPDYRGIIGIVLFNFGPERFIVNKGDAVAQLICERYCEPCVELVSKIDIDTERGEGGFGSSDSKKVKTCDQKPSGQ